MRFCKNQITVVQVDDRLGLGWIYSQYDYETLCIEYAATRPSVRVLLCRADSCTSAHATGVDPTARASSAGLPAPRLDQPEWPLVLQVRRDEPRRDSAVVQRESRVAAFD